MGRRPALALACGSVDGLTRSSLRAAATLPPLRIADDVLESKMGQFSAAGYRPEAPKKSAWQLTMLAGYITRSADLTVLLPGSAGSCRLVVRGPPARTAAMVWGFEPFPRRMRFFSNRDARC